MVGIFMFLDSMPIYIQKLFICRSERQYIKNKVILSEYAVIYFRDMSVFQYTVREVFEVSIKY